MKRIIDALWRLGLRVVYQLLRLVWFVLRPKHRGALVAVWHDGRVLLIRNSYRQLLSFPGGGVRSNELPAEAAARELHEEVGIDVRPGELTFVCDIQVTFDFLRDRCAIFAIELSSAPDIIVDGREVVSGSFMSRRDALNQGLLPPVRAYLTRASG